MKKISFGLFLLLLFYVPSYGQSVWNISSYGLRATEVLKLPLKSSPNYDESRCYPGNPGCGVLVLREDLQKRSKNDFEASLNNHFGNKIDLSHQFNFPHPQTINVRTAKLVAELYTENIATVYFICKDTHRGWVYFEHTIPSEGYHTPITKSVGSWEAQTNGALMSKTNLEFKSFIVACVKKNPALQSELVLNQCKFIEYESREKSFAQPWIDSLVGKTAIHDYIQLVDYSNWTHHELGRNTQNSSIPTYGDFYNTLGYNSQVIRFTKEGASLIEELSFISEVAKAFIDNYPYYSERSLSRTNIRSHWKDIESKFKSGPYKSSIELLSDFIETAFRDPHFSVYINSVPLGEPDLVKGPLRLYNFGSHVEVVAVFNENYKDNIPLGSIVVAIDDEDINDYLGKYKNLSGAISRTKCSGIRLTYHKPYDYTNTYTEYISYDVPLKIDPKYRSSHTKSYNLPDSIIYYKFRNWTGDTFYTLLNKYPQISTSNGLILDLRDNGGGYGQDCFNSLSMFIQEPITLGNIIYSSHQKESLLVFPSHKNYNFPMSLPLVILINTNTACSSELFLLGLETRPNTYVIGSGNSMGAVAGPTLFTFPSGLTIRFPYVGGKLELDLKYYREGMGMQPDYLVSLTHYKDLYPYKDKILSVAQRFLKRIIELKK